MTAVCGYILTLCDIVTEVYRCEHDIHCGKIISIVCIESLSKSHSLTYSLTQASKQASKH